MSFKDYLQIDDLCLMYPFKCSTKEQLKSTNDVSKIKSSAIQGSALCDDQV